MSKPKAKTHSLTWRGTFISIKHTPRYFDHADHVEVIVKKPKLAILPITETGYKSHFVDPDQLKTVGGPVSFIHAELEREANTKRWKELSQKLNQLDFLNLLIQPIKPTKKRAAKLARLS